MADSSSDSPQPAGGGGPVLAIALGAVIIVVAVVLVMSIQSKPADTDAPGTHTHADGTVHKDGDHGHDHTDKPADGDKPTSGGEPVVEPGPNKPKPTPGVVTIGEGSGEELADLDIELPNPVFAGTPKEVPKGVNIDMKRFGKPRVKVVAPKGLKNVAVDKEVTSSDDFPIIGDLEMVTDNDKEALDGRFVELAPGKQWVQIDLEQEYEIWVVAVWHNHLDPRVYRDVIVQLSNDPEFKEGVTTIFNNDNDNSSKMGKGEDFEYFENYEGEVMGAKEAVKARYVRAWSNGSTADDANHYSEIEVFAKEAK